MKFTDPIAFEPRKRPASHSWWATPRAQASREGFVSLHSVEVARIVGDERFGGRKRVHDDGLKGSK